MDFIAIDFETANESRSSACALGIIYVEGSKVVRKKYFLIKPSDMYFNPFNVSIHGITEEDVEDKPEFNELWPQIKDDFNGKLIVAHNASFDMSVLRYVMDEYGIIYPELSYSCTKIIAKKVWPNHISYCLDYIANNLNIEFVHHNAEEDASACAQIAIKAMEQAGVSSIIDLASKFNFSNGRLFPSGYQPMHESLTTQRFKPSDLVASTSEFDPNHPFFKRTIVFTGILQSMTRKEAMQKVVDVGGSCLNSISSS
jgi:DNA polymerase-3 subunit epsilon